MDPIPLPPQQQEKTSNTKIIGVLLILVAVSNTVIDALNGGGFDYTTHVNDVMAALAGSGLIFLRTAIGKVQKLLQDLNAKS